MTARALVAVVLALTQPAYALASPLVAPREQQYVCAAAGVPANSELDNHGYDEEGATVGDAGCILIARPPLCAAAWRQVWRTIDRSCVTEVAKFTVIDVAEGDDHRQSVRLSDLGPTQRLDTLARCYEANRQRIEPQMNPAARVHHRH